MIIMQRVVIQMSDYEVYQLPFASTLFIFDNQTSNLVQIIYVFLTIFLYLLKCPQSLILSALRAFLLLW